MSRTVHVASSGVRIPISAERVKRAAETVLRLERVTSAELSITFVDERQMSRLNLKHLGHRGSTDIISFGFAPEVATPLTGDVYICPDVARRNALEHGVGIREELLRLVVHGTLHVLGHEHPVDDTRTKSPMWRRQERLLSRELARA